jgi:hypothetical protein
MAVGKGYMRELPESTKVPASERDMGDVSGWLTSDVKFWLGFGACSGLADEFPQAIDLY